MKKYLFVSVVLLLSACLFAGEATNDFTNPLLPPAEKMTKPQSTLARAVPLKKIDSDSGLEKLTGFPTGAGNAAQHYAKLEELFKTDRVDEKSLALKPRASGISEIFKAVTLRECKFTPDFYPPLTAGTAKQPDVLVFLSYAQALLELAKELENKQDFKGAGLIYQSGLIFGWHLTQNPESLLVLMLGVRIKGMFAKRYGEFARLQYGFDNPREKAASAYFTLLTHAQTMFERKLGYFLGNTLAFNSLYSVIRVATEDEDQAWRREAIVRLGVYRFGAPGSGGEIIYTDAERQKAAEQALAQIAEKDANATNRELAVWAINKLTPEIFMNLFRKQNSEK